MARMLKLYSLAACLLVGLALLLAGPVRAEVSAETPTHFQLHNIELKAPCFVAQDALTPLYAPLIDKPSTMADLTHLLDSLRSALADQGLEDIRLQLPLEKLTTERMFIEISAKVPAQLRDKVASMCGDTPIPIADDSAHLVVNRNLVQVEIQDATAQDLSPLKPAMTALLNKKFNAGAVAELMRSIRQQYLDAGLPGPYTQLDKTKLPQGILILRVVEKKRIQQTPRPPIIVP